MARYLVFELSEDDAKHSVFADYTLGTSNLLPRYFGDIASVNIFLGENNSGKSRFMREIMKCDPTRLFDFGPNIQKLVKAIENLPTVDTAKEGIFGLDVVVRPAEAKQYAPEILKTISQEDINGHSQFQFKLALENILPNVESGYKFFSSKYASISSILSLLTHTQLNARIEKLGLHLLDLRKAKILYDHLLGVNAGPHRIHSKSVEFALGYATIGIQAGEVSPNFNTKHNSDKYLAKAAKSLDQIIGAGEALMRAVAPFETIQTESRNRTYIPTLRTARTLVDRQDNPVSYLDDVMLHTTNKDYDLKPALVSVNTGLELFKDVDEKKNSDITDRADFKKFEAFLSETFFNGKDVEVVPNRKTTTILVAVDGEERALPYLGDGIQAIILLLYPLFIAKKGAWFFIEEPETHLHPGFQRLFVETIATHKVLLEKGLTIFLTTHSNHMLDFALDKAKNINLFTFRKSQIEKGKATYQVQLTAPHDLACLTALGVQNSSVFLSNCTIWVEGITDRIYLKAYLKAYLKHKNQVYSLLEGLHYSFLEYAGSNVSHYTFGIKSQDISITQESLDSIQALSISNRIMLIADQDSGKEAKHERLTVQKHAGFEYVVLETREIENLLTPVVITGALNKLFPKLDFDASKLNQEQYHNIYLGHYLRKKFSDIPETFAPSKPKGSGTISSARKRQFAEAVAEVITEWDMLSPEAKTLTERVFKFIIGHNPRLGSN